MFLMSYMLESTRTFRLWSYTVSHCQLLLRSARNTADRDSLNLDVLFSGVSHIELSDTLRGLRLRAASQQDEAAPDGASRHQPRAVGKLFLLESSGRTFKIEAVAVRVMENTLRPDQTGFDIETLRDEAKSSPELSRDFFQNYFLRLAGRVGALDDRRLQTLLSKAIAAVGGAKTPRLEAYRFIADILSEDAETLGDVDRRSLLSLKDELEDQLVR